MNDQAVKSLFDTSFMGLIFQDTFEFCVYFISLLLRYNFLETKDQILTYDCIPDKHLKLVL